MSPRGIELRSLVEGAELRMVERIIHLHAELQLEFLADWEASYQRNIEVVRAGAADQELGWSTQRAVGRAGNTVDWGLLSLPPR